MIIKLSFSIIDAWRKGNWEQAVGLYIGRPLPATPAMELGSLKHEIWANHILAHRTMPQELGGYHLEAPIVEQKYEKLIPFTDDMDILLRGRIDCEDGEILYDWKCGLTKPSQHISSLQPDYYKFLRPHATQGRIISFNPYTGTHKTAIKFLDDTNAENALEDIITYGGEIIDYLKSQKLLKAYTPA